MSEERQRPKRVEQQEEVAKGPDSGPGTVLAKRRGDRVVPENRHNLSPLEVRDMATVLDGAAAGTAMRPVIGGEGEDLAALEPWALLESAGKVSPVEALVLRSMGMASAQQRQLLALSGSLPPGSDAARRYAELGLKAAREVVRAAEVWRKLRLPPTVNVGPGGQANVVGGDQHISSGEQEVDGGTD